MSRELAKEIWDNHIIARDKGECSHLQDFNDLYILAVSRGISQETDREISSAMQLLKKDGKVMYRSSYKKWQFLYSPDVKKGGE